MKSEEEYLENIYVSKMSGGKHFLKKEIVWEFLNKTKLHYSAITFRYLHNCFENLFSHRNLDTNVNSTFIIIAKTWK